MFFHFNKTVSNLLSTTHVKPSLYALNNNINEIENLPLQQCGSYIAAVDCESLLLWIYFISKLSETLYLSIVFSKTNHYLLKSENYIRYWQKEETNFIPKRSLNSFLK